MVLAVGKLRIRGESIGRAGTRTFVGTRGPWLVARGNHLQAQSIPIAVNAFDVARVQAFARGHLLRWSAIGDRSSVNGLHRPLGNESVCQDSRYLRVLWTAETVVLETEPLVFAAVSPDTPSCHPL